MDTMIMMQPKVVYANANKDNFNLCKQHGIE